MDHNGDLARLWEAQHGKDNTLRAILKAFVNSTYRFFTVKMQSGISGTSQRP
jgi:hypothetical protein